MPKKNSMKQLLLFLIGLLLFSSCKKEAEPEPVASARVAGTYVVSRVAYTGPTAANNYDITLPRSVSGITQSGTLVADKFNSRDDAVTVKVTIKTTGQQDAVIDLEDFELKANGSAYDVIYNTVKYGTADGTNINIDYTEANQRIIVVAKRQ